MTDFDWQAAQYKDEQELQERILNALEAALTRPLTLEEAMLLGWASGCANELYRNTTPDMTKRKP